MSIELRGISKSFGEQIVVKRLSLSVEDGEFFVLLGASGSGKSTVLRLIAGLHNVDHGSIHHNGTDITNLATQKRNVGFVFQSYALFKHLDVAGNIEFALRLRNVSQEIRAARVEELLELVGLTGLESRHPHQLSGGQRQRVALARALAHRPQILLLDEPFAALDQKIRRNLRARLKAIQERLGITTILVTHDQEEAFELGRRVGIIDRGLLVEVGTAEDLYHHPRTEFVANFIGGGNVLVGRSSGGAVRLGSSSLELGGAAPQHPDGAPVRILFRPEHTFFGPIGTEAPPDARMLGEGVIGAVHFAGAVQRYQVELDSLQDLRPAVPALAYGQPGVSLQALVLSSSSSGLPNVGKRVWVAAKNFHILHASSLRILAMLRCGAPNKEVVELAAFLGRATHGLLNFVGVVDDEAAVEAARSGLVTELQSTLSSSDVAEKIHVRAGRERREIVREAQELLYDLVVLPSEADHLAELAGALLTQVKSPVLLPQSGRASIKKMLVCTRGGEPGKGDLRIGARIARHADAHVTVLHVAPHDLSDERLDAVERHLEGARATLRTLRLQHEVKIVRGPASERIRAEVKAGEYDLVVLGASPAPDGGSFLYGRIAVLVQQLNIPVLLVPVVD